MIIQSARLAASQLLEPRFRRIVWKSLGLTVLMFVGMWLGVDLAVSTFLTPLLGPWPWVTTLVVWLFGAGMVVGAGFLLAPVTAIFAGLFLDDVAEEIEENHYPQDESGKALPIAVSIWLAIKFTALVIGANLIALLLVLLPGINFAIFFLLNGYLLGREYFQFAAMRFHREKDAAALRKRHSLEVFLSGLVIAGFMAIPILNLFTPIFAAIMMVHVHKLIEAKQADLAPAAQ